MRQLEAGLLMLERQMISFRMQRTVLLYTLQLNLLASNGWGVKFSEVIEQMANLGYKKGLEALSGMVAMV